MRAPSPLPPPTPHALRMPMPMPDALAALGTVLCVYRSRCGDGLGGELGGWQQAVRAETWCGIDSDGWQECLQFRDRDGDCCWRLYLLPDSDFLAWERLQQTLPRVEAPHATCRDCGLGREDGIAGRLWRRASLRLRGERWQLSALRLHALSSPHGAPIATLAASLAPVSPLGADMLQRVARLEDIDLGAPFDAIGATPWRVAHAQ